jgi:hypothetical protein
VSTKPTGKRIEREAHLRWVPLGKMRVNPLAQRDLNQARVDKLAAEMELEQFGNPTVNCRDDWFYLIDGQHRVEALKKWLGEGQWEDQSIQCWVYDADNALSEEEEAEVFLKLNDTLTVAAFEKFRIAVKSGRPDETDIDRIVRAQGLRISREHNNGAIGAVGTLRKVYRLGPAVLAQTLGIIRDAYGDAGLEAGVIEGLGLMCSRYNGELNDAVAVERLSKARGGVNGLINGAGILREKTGWPRAHCVAASAVNIYNRSRGGGGKKLPSWARDDESS